MSETIILLMSKYSDNCSKLMKIMKSSELNFSFIDTIFIDNAKIRESVISKKDYNITSVPTILVFKPGQVQKFDNMRAFQWIQQTIKNLKQTEQDKEDIEDIQEEEDRIYQEIEIQKQVQQKVAEQMEELKMEMQQQLQQSLHKSEGPKTDINSLLENNVNFDEEPTEGIDMNAAEKLIEKSVKKGESIADKMNRMEAERKEIEQSSNALLKQQPQLN